MNNWIADCIREADDISAKKKALDNGISPIWDDLKAAIEDSVKSYSGWKEAPATATVENNGDRRSITIKVGRKSEAGMNHDNIEVRLDPGKYKIFVRRSGAESEESFSIRLNGSGKAALFLEEKEITRDQAAEIILRPALFPELRRRVPTGT